MSSTLTALHAAMIANPADRTVRLVYADALDESDDPANATRAAFIRAQIELEALPEGDPKRPEVETQCRELFAANWLDWWRPFCAAVDLPEPYAPSQTLRARAKRLLNGDRREPGAPYTAELQDCVVASHEHGFIVNFIAGFPELLFINAFTIDTLTGQYHRWFAHAPFHRLRLPTTISEFEWDSLNGPHLAKVTELQVPHLTAPIAVRLAQADLRGLVSLWATPIHPVAEVVRALVCNPPWRQLRALMLQGTCPPNALRTLATDCTLTELEELSFGIREITATTLPAAGGFLGALGVLVTAATTGMVSQLLNPTNIPGPIAAADYWPALETLCRAPLFRQLRRFGISDSRNDHLLGRMISALNPLLGPDEIFPGPLVKALADGLNADKLERLELPRARLSDESQAELAARFGSRLVLA